MASETAGSLDDTNSVIQWDQSSQYAPTPGFWGRGSATPSVISSVATDRHLGDDLPAFEPPLTKAGRLPLLDFAEWSERNTYDEQPPSCIHYSIEWKVTLNNRIVAKDTEQDLVLGPRNYWRLFLEPKLIELIGKKFPRKRVKSDDTTIVVSVNQRSQRDLTRRFDQTDIDWSAIEKQLLDWGELFATGKKLRLSISFGYIEHDHSATAIPLSAEKRGWSSATQRMLLARDTQINAEESSSEQASVWKHVYSVMRCPGPPCELGPHCWRDPFGKKHYKVGTHHLRSLIKYVEQGGELNTHDDVPHDIRENLYHEEQQRLDRGSVSRQSANGNSCPPINITNVLPSQSIPSASPPLSAQTVAMQDSGCLNIPGLRDVAVEEYSDWQQSQVGNEILKGEFRKARDTALSDGLDLGQIFKDQDSSFFIKQGVKRGIARRFVTDIEYWVKRCKLNTIEGEDLHL